MFFMQVTVCYTNVGVKSLLDLKMSGKLAKIAIIHVMLPMLRFGLTIEYTQFFMHISQILFVFNVFHS